MKTLPWISRITVLALLCAPPAFGQTPAPTEAAGTVAVWRADRGIILEKDVAAPVPFTFAKKVDYADKAGKAMAREDIQPGDPITIRYTREGGRLLVSRVIVERKSVPAATTSTETTGTASPKTAAGKTDDSNEAKQIDKIRASIEKESRLLSEHPH